jgi:hypothetical protein
VEVAIRPVQVRDFADVYELGLRSYKLTDSPYNYWSIGEVADHVATRLLQTVVDVAERMGKARVVADIASDNTYSQGLARKLGFSEGISVTYFTKELRR